MAVRDFRDLASELKDDWGSDTQAVYEAASASYDAEITARQALGSELARARAERHLTQPALAEAANVQQAEISRIENGRSNPTFATVVRLADALGLEVSLVKRQHTHA